jgi:hypothetical protein
MVNDIMSYDKRLRYRDSPRIRLVSQLGHREFSVRPSWLDVGEADTKNVSVG